MMITHWKNSGGSRLEQSGIDLKEKRNKYQGGHGALVTKGNRFFYDEEGNLAKKIDAIINHVNRINPTDMIMTRLWHDTLIILANTRNYHDI